MTSALGSATRRAIMLFSQIRSLIKPGLHSGGHCQVWILAAARRTTPSGQVAAWGQPAARESGRVLDSPLNSLTWYLMLLNDIDGKLVLVLAGLIVLGSCCSLCIALGGVARRGGKNGNVKRKILKRQGYDPTPTLIGQCCGGSMPQPLLADGATELHYSADERMLVTCLMCRLHAIA